MIYKIVYSHTSSLDLQCIFDYISKQLKVPETASKQMNQY